MTEKTLSYLGLCRRAGKLALGHDAVAESVRTGSAKLCLLTSDASPRHKRELDAAHNTVKVFEMPVTAQELSFAIGKKVCVLAVTDDGFAKAVQKQFEEEAT
ncbi:MAG: ribosomal L7Ae/L30e/S12e/Gadd45 family protein [Clostridia bacterium]|nr:ribosomal L7Ae/L30e/S12e/Gadd45 family protein [Clostridia bacterium]